VVGSNGDPTDARKLVNTKKTVDDTAIVHNASFV